MAVETGHDDGRLLLRAGRVTLREHTAEDAAELMDYQSCGLVWIDGVPGAETAGAAGMTVRAAVEGLHRPPWGMFAILRSHDLTALGTIGFHGPPDDGGMVEIGYDLSVSARGAGWATDAARLLTSWALGEPGVVTVLATTQPGNLPSQRVLERTGFTRVADRDPLWAYELTAATGPAPTGQIPTQGLAPAPDPFNAGRRHPRFRRPGR
ncbi:GNAT family N-acetyltransferase [Streptomyces sp. NPDC004647]|uniref:GNAT family N-acetyltransferase n=1 Tax=Streptomyces sp. NPDC004647 TaxID=3154671 RepID=UPI0033A0742C